jgi:hypothetical protein
MVSYIPLFSSRRVFFTELTQKSSPGKEQSHFLSISGPCEVNAHCPPPNDLSSRVVFILKGNLFRSLLKAAKLQ